MPPLLPWFTPSRAEIWRQLSQDLGARFTEGGWRKSDRVEACHSVWTITLDSFFDAASKMPYTRFRAPYVNPDGFRFTIYRKGLFTGIAKWMGMQDIEVGYSDFDEPFVIKGTDESKVRSLFGNARLRELVAAQPKVHFAVQDLAGWFQQEQPPTTDVLTFTAAGVLKDRERLEQLFDLLAVTLDQLCEIGSAYEDAPPRG